jgi:hypothetical protein
VSHVREDIFLRSRSCIAAWLSARKMTPQLCTATTRHTSWYDPRL